MLLNNVLLFFAAFWLETTSATRPQAKIVGGDTISIKDVPFIVSIQFQGNHICGGSFLGKNKVVTAAHCTDGKMSSDFTIRAGSTLREEGGQVASVKNIYQNPKFKDTKVDYDVSILELDTNLNESESVSPITLASADQTFEYGTKAFAFGWGTFRSNSTRLAKELQSVTLKFVDEETCQECYDEMIITDRMLCAGSHQGGKDACQGDSGGPLVVEGVLAGITSFGSGCGNPEFPGVYASVAALRDYIDRYV